MDDEFVTKVDLSKKRYDIVTLNSNPLVRMNRNQSVVHSDKISFDIQH